MSSILELMVPEHEQCEAAIRDYYEYVLEKEQALRPDIDRNQVKEFAEYQQAIQRLESESRFFVYENLSSTIAKAIDMPAFRNAFEQNDDYHERIIVDPENIQTVIELLREAKVRLIENPPVDVDWELILETNTIALCEFALEHGYGIEYSQ